MIWPDSDTGTRKNAIRITNSEEEILVLYSSSDGFAGQWGLKGWFIHKEVLEKLTPQEQELLLGMGTNLPAGGMPAFAKPVLEDRRDTIDSAKLEQVLEKVFTLCRNEEKKLEKKSKKPRKK